MWVLAIILAQLSAHTGVAPDLVAGTIDDYR
jgi:hypothetical protein